MNYTIRDKCIFCNNKLTFLMFENDYKIPIACYGKELNDKKDICIPYNIYTCDNCKTSQTKYLGDLNLIYEINHADSTGSLMKNLHKRFLDIISKYQDKITNIVEIGSAKGILSDLLIENIKTLDKYYIIDPGYFGKINSKKIIINNFFENVNIEKYNEANTVIISHVFEHFYNPLDILEKIKLNSNIQNFFLIWPDLQYYKNNKNYHVLNTEHIYYVDNDFIIKLMNNYNFKLIERQNYENHSVIFIFERSNNLPLIQLYNQDNDITQYIDKIKQDGIKIQQFIDINKNKNICMWPCSVHTQYLLTLNPNIKLNFVLDNSPNKIGKYLYGFDLLCKSFSKEIINEKNAIILNGGVFNNEIKKYINNNKHKAIFFYL